MTSSEAQRFVKSCGTGQIGLEQGDITAIEVDCIANAANAPLAGGGGVDGAIHRVGGPSIARELQSRYPKGCPTGKAVVTQAGRLSARFVIHAVGPRWQGGNSGDETLLRGAYRSSLKLADERGCEDIAFPAISCGVYGYPLHDGARVAIETVIDWLQDEGRSVRKIRFVLFEDSTYAAFERALGESF